MLAGGCDSPVRSGWSVGGPMFVQARRDGAYAYDEDGRRYVDYIMAYGPLLFGHTHPALVTGLDELAQAGFVWGTTHPEEIRLAERDSRAYLPVDGAHALCHDRNRGGDERDPRRACLYAAFA